MITQKLKNFGHFLGLFAGLMVYLGTTIFLILLYINNIYINIVLSIILFYQYFLQKETPGFRRFINKLAPYHYFKEDDLIIEESPLPSSKSMFCFHPHGILVMSLPFSCLRNEILFKSKMLVFGGLLYMPISGLFVKLLGGHPVSSPYFKKFLNKGENISFSPGGFEEATISNHREDRIFIKNRKGFIKYALEYGYKVFPAYTFNENKAYLTWNGLEKFRLWLNKWKFPGAVFWGKFYFFPINDLKFYTVIGKGIQFPKIDNPNVEIVNEYHQKYINELENIFNKYKNIYGGSDKIKIY